MTKMRSGLLASCLALAGLAATSAARATENYFYDATGRMIMSTIDNGAGEAYKFDNASNRSTLTIWNQSQPTAMSGMMTSNQRINRDQTAVSADGRFFIAVQGDGNIVLYQNGQAALWQTATIGKQSAYLIMQTDGNLVVYDAYGAAVWSSGTGGNPGAQLAVQTDGNLVIYYNNKAIWSSGTSGH